MTLIIFSILKSKYCKIVFILSMIILTFLVPKKIFYGFYILLGILFILVTSFVITCFVRSVKEKFFSVKESGASLLGMITALLGFSSLHFCTIGAPVCGSYLGAGLFAILFPGVAFNFFEKYSLLIFLISLLFEVFALKLMGCLSSKSDS